MLNKSHHVQRKSKLLRYEENLRSIFLSLTKAISDLPGDPLAIQSYQKRESLYREGFPIGGAYWLKSGEAKIYKTGTEGRNHILRIAYPGDFMGLESLFCTPEASSSSAEMLKDGDISFVDRYTLSEAIRVNSGLAFQMIQALAAQVVFSEEENVDLAQNTVRERMARLLATISRNHGVVCEQGVQIELNFSREELAEMIGTAPETVMRLIKDFREEKIIAVEGRKILVFELERLVRLAHLETPVSSNLRVYHAKPDSFISIIIK